MDIKEVTLTNFDATSVLLRNINAHEPPGTEDKGDINKTYHSLSHFLP